MSRSIAHLALLLGLITAVGPFAIDIYLPALPTLGASLHASPALVQMSLTVFFVIVGVCQLFYGPISDVFGRKPPIYAGLVIFCRGECRVCAGADHRNTDRLSCLAGVWCVRGHGDSAGHRA